MFIFIFILAYLVKVRGRIFCRKDLRSEGSESGPTSMFGDILKFGDIRQLKNFVHQVPLMYCVQHLPVLYID